MRPRHKAIQVGVAMALTVERANQLRHGDTLVQEKLSQWIVVYFDSEQATECIGSSHLFIVKLQSETV
ncbi:hypothetical protein PGT21_032628 [Puccinia graminis f. sp. tritici]|uniref:Uncharacterized protein n=1 Tax=Puccinia graminis f. sp. tritici TaxID=56615 RepID=A0A5B0Q7X5_PUCGR|nr:hypothetical protein PGT21_032628 [Puccinia graminis f. sp. tritici]